ncbi:PREDICTED: 14 kDa proline-rich protein DC2.15-like [Nelumbo nucifera]|uniref:Bifunctional inhibitor/plant lipid transfer protein/seed storage helical domain-containing protein n=2 Tax=Nelumbo nucifera TaxID=4432 RepID=A0A822ZFQ0_NELNU|nr:PREDICTED: 14 kDa proline-rich protein DC2.15-like [Nelumbo nucifera]DAD44994.1 TPA_asm: hypothetical protein HUJ06_003224 [Nelumbo nucifera]
MATKISASAIALVFFTLLCSAAFSSACVPCNPKPNPSPKFPPNLPPKSPPANPFCPRDTLKLGACSELLGGLVNHVAGTPPSSKCCTLLDGLVDAEAAACICTVIKENAFGIKLEWSVAFSMLVSACKKSIPPGFKCV